MNLKQVQKFHAVVSEILEKVEGDSDGAKINRIEKSLTRYFLKQWNPLATRAQKRGVNAIKGNGDRPFTKTDARRVIAAVEKEFKGIGNAVEKRTRKDYAEIYDVSLKRFSDRFPQEDLEKIARKQHVELRKVGEEISAAELAAFNIEATAVTDQLTYLTTTSIGDHFPKTLKPQITNTIQKAILDKGLNKRQAGDFLQKELARKLGGNAPSAVPPNIAKQGQDSINAYFEGLSATNVTAARNLSHVQIMDEAEIVRIRYAAIIDELTSEICASLNGRVFTIDQVKVQAKLIMDAESVEELKGTQPWVKNLNDFKTRGDINNPKNNQVLVEAGVIFPPRHFRCRSELEPA